MIFNKTLRALKEWMNINGNSNSSSSLYYNNDKKEQKKINSFNSTGHRASSFSTRPAPIIDESIYDINGLPPSKPMKQHSQEFAQYKTNHHYQAPQNIMNQCDRNSLTLNDFRDDSYGNNSTSPVEIQPFKRTSIARMSLPILRRQAFFHQQQMLQQQKQPSMGQVFLQFRDETKQATLPNELTTIHTIQALFVCSFPNLLTMEYLSQSHVKIYIYNSSCNIFYELRDISEVKNESVLRIHQSDPIQALPQFTHMAPKVPPPKPRRMILANNHYETYTTCYK